MVLSRHVRPDGTWLLTGIAARPGVLEYRDGDGNVTRELVPMQTLEDSAATLGRATVTLQHPREDVTPENVGTLGVGDVDSLIDTSAGYVQVRVAVRRKDAIEAVASGRSVELSPGYRVRLDMTPGVDPVHGRYDAVQVERTVNHLAIVDRARGGPTVRLRTDAAETVNVFTAGTPAQQPRKSMNVRLAAILAALGISTRFDTDDGALDALSDTLRSRNDAATVTERERLAALATATRERDEARTALTTLTADRDALRARADAADAALTTLRTEARTRADADERAALAPLCARFRIDPKAHAELPALKRAIATAKLGSALRADATDAYVDALLDMARSDLSAGVSAGQRAWAPNAGAARNDGGNAPLPSRRKSANEMQAEAIAAERKRQGIA